ncbi:MAG: hypothetical protein DRQ08_05395 [Candidatus Latescibacterota bacterium]|nr:MAG: hypothetical protein DRQ08_05395 [Candidatus Latescibacterota bacterium]
MSMLFWVSVLLGTGWAGETVETIAIRKVLGDELAGWNMGNAKLIVLQYAPYFRGYRGDAGRDPATWEPGFRDLGEFEAFCREAVSRYRFDLSRNPIYFDIYKNKALVVAEDGGEAVERASGRRITFSYKSLWTLEKEGGSWKITGFLRKLPGWDRGSLRDSDGVREVLLGEARAWQEGDPGKVVGLYGADFVGYEGYDRGDTEKWRISFSGLAPFRAFCRKRLSRTSYTISRKVISVKALKGSALAVTEEKATTTHKLTGKKLSAEHRDLWMLEKEGKSWKIVGFVRRLGSTARDHVSRGL